MVALREAFYIENERYELDTMRVPNRSPTPISKSNDFLRQSDDVFWARGPHFRPTLGAPGVRDGLKHMFFSILKRPPRVVVTAAIRFSPPGGPRDFLLALM